MGAAGETPMKVTYDQQADALYIELVDAPVADTVHIDRGTLVDLNAQGQLIGVELIRPARPWPLATILNRFPADPTSARILRLLERAAGDAGTFGYAEPIQLVSA
jgi:uncharacterized protein YuzE